MSIQRLDSTGRHVDARLLRPAHPREVDRRQYRPSLIDSRRDLRRGVCVVVPNVVADRHTDSEPALTDDAAQPLEQVRAQQQVSPFDGKVRMVAAIMDQVATP